MAPHSRRVEFLYVSRFWHALTALICSEGKGRVTIFAAQSNARTFDYQVNSSFQYIRLSQTFVLRLISSQRLATSVWNKPFMQAPSMVIDLVNRLRPRKHGYGNINVFYSYTEEVSRSLCWKYRKYNPQISGDIQIECVIYPTKLHSMLTPPAGIVEDISLSNVRRTTTVAVLMPFNIFCSG